MLIVELLGVVSVVVVADTERERFGLSGVLELELGGSKFFSLISSKNSESVRVMEEEAGRNREPDSENAHLP